MGLYGAVAKGWDGKRPREGSGGGGESLLP